jgi:membrane protease subunit HflK
MERVLGNSDKLVYDGGPSGQGIVPYLPLNELTRRPAPTSQPQQSTGGSR